jgi:signal transduction histidine kinase
VASGLIHDFNNLLSMIQGTVRMLGRGVSPEKSKELLELANDAVNRGAKLVNQVLTLARPERSGAVVADVRRILQDMRPLVHHAAGRDTRLHWDIDQPVPSVKIDPVQFEVAILNLVVNGRDAMPNGGDLTISVANHAASGPEGQPWNDGVRVSVADTGVGMDQEVQKRIFEPFFTTKPRDKGNGLGLASVHAFIAQCSGRLEVMSEVGRGTTISMLIPPASMISAKEPLSG